MCAKECTLKQKVESQANVALTPNNIVTLSSHCRQVGSNNRREHCAFTVWTKSEISQPTRTLRYSWIIIQSSTIKHLWIARENGSLMRMPRIWIPISDTFQPAFRCIRQRYIPCIDSRILAKTLWMPYADQETGTPKNRLGATMAYMAETATTVSVKWNLCEIKQHLAIPLHTACKCERPTEIEGPENPNGWHPQERNIQYVLSK